MNVKFYKNFEGTGKILKISCVRCNFVKFSEVISDGIASSYNYSYGNE